MNTIRRIVMASATALLVVAVPMGVAHADDHGGPSGSASVTVTDAQRAGIISARAAYLDSSAAINKTYRATMQSISDGVVADTSAQALALDKAKDALQITAMTGGDTAAAKAAVDAAQTALQDALSAAKASAKTKSDAARATQQQALDAAKTAYQAAVTALFPAGATIPGRLLDPPGRNGHGMGGGNSQGGNGRGGMGNGGMGNGGLNSGGHHSGH
jgi:hypothetical protein